jgi:DNA replication and repair protein RecF
MILSRVTPQNFRNLDSAPIEFHPTTNIIVGRNGQGKTNLVEALYFLATTKSFRTPRVANVIRFGSTNVFVSGLLQRFGVEKGLSVGLEIGEIRRRALLINEEQVSLSTYLKTMSVFAFSSARMEIFRGGPEERRRFLDRGLASVDSTHLDSLTHYARILRQRNALLQSGSASTAALDAWDAEFRAAAAVIQQARAAYTEELGRAFGNIVEQYAYHVRDLRLLYRPSLAEDPLRARREELRAGVSLFGPHRDNVEFVINGRPAADVASAGEQKMLVLFLKFAKLELFRRKFDEPAVFLLDDVDAELDLEILQNLLIRLPQATQVFATSAKERFLASLQAGPHRRLIIESGRVTTAGDFA